MKTFKSFKANLEEKKLTPAEMKKREEVAKAIHRENPNMPMGMKMAIATKTAKRVAEEEELEESIHILSGESDFMKKHAKSALDKVGAKIHKVTHDENSGTSEYHVSHDQRDRILHASKQLEKKGGQHYGGMYTESFTLEANEYHKIAAKHLKDMMKKDVTPTQKEYARKMNKRALEAAKMSDPEAAKKHYMGVNEEEELDEAAWGKDKAANLKDALNRHTEKAIAANKAGDHEAVKVHQSKMNMIKNQMSKLVKEQELDELNQMTLQRYASKAYRVGMQGGPNSAKHLAGSQRAKEKLKYGDYSEEVEQVDEVVKQAHKVVVTVSEPDHPMVSKRKETVMKRVVVHATDKGEAKAKAESFYKKKGYKVHGSEYHSVQPASTLKTEETLDEVSKKTAVSYIQKKVSQIAKRPGEAMLYTTKMTGSDYENLKRAYKRAGVKEEVKDEYARKVDKYLKKKYNKEEFDLDEATQFPSKEHAINYAKEKVKTHKDSDDGIEVYSMPGGGARVVHTMNSQGRQQVLKGGGKKVTTVTREQVELDEAGPFSYGAKPPKKGSVAYNAMMKRKEQDNKPPIEPKDQMVGTAKLQKEEVEDQHYCAKHVYSNVYGEGVVLEGQHADPDENGNIEWYVVNFAEGPKKVYTEKLDIMIAEYHGNHKKKRMTNG